MTVFEKICWGLAMLTLGLLGICQYRWPQDWWRSWEGTFYKNPEAVEPSEDGYKARRFGGLILTGFALVVFLVVMFAIPGELSKEERAKRDAESMKSARAIVPPVRGIAPRPSPTP